MPVPLILYSLSSSYIKCDSMSPDAMVEPHTGQLDGSLFFCFVEKSETIMRVQMVFFGLIEVESIAS